MQFCHSFLHEEVWGDFYRKIEKEENGRNIAGGEHILVSGLLDEAMKIPFGNRSDPEAQEALRVWDLAEGGNPVVRGEPVPVHNERNGVVDFPVNNNCTVVDFDDGCEMGLSEPTDVAAWRHEDIVFTQESQKTAAECIGKQPAVRYMQGKAVYDEWFKIVENDDEMFGSMVEMMKAGANDARASMAQKMKQKESGGGREQETVGDVWTGKNTKKRLKRQKAFYEK